MAPRLAIIGGEAVVDPALSDRDVRVLALLGRHTNDNGWCWRSQGEMAKELGISRPRINASIARLVDTGWVEKRERTRADGGTASCHYRVRLDLADEEVRAAARRRQTRRPAAEEEGAGEGVAAGVPEAASGGGSAGDSAGDSAGQSPCSQTAPPCPPDGQGPVPQMDTHKNDEDSNDPPLPPLPGGFERESAREICEEDDPGERAERAAREADAESREAEAALDAFLAAWPVKSDIRGKCVGPWRELSPAERTAAAAAIEPFFADLRLHKRGAPPAASTYLKDRVWSRMRPAEPAGAAKAMPRRQVVRAFSKDWWFVLWRHGFGGQPRAAKLMIAMTTSGRGGGGYGVPVELMPTAAELAAMVPVKVRSAEFVAWDRAFQARGAGYLPHVTEWAFFVSALPAEAGGAARDDEERDDAGRDDEARVLFDGR